MPEEREYQRRNRIVLGLVIWAGAMAAQFAEAQDAPLPSVTVAMVSSENITPSFNYVGRVEAADKVELRARVEGYLQTRNFREGALVDEGDLLFVLDKRPYQVIVDQRSADLAGAEASLKNARASLARQQDLRAQGLTSQADLDAAEAAEATARAAVLQARAVLEAAKLDLDYTEIHSPIAGQISRARYSVGDLVDSNSEPLATVTRLDPTYVTIAVSEKDLLAVRREGIDLDNPRYTPSLLLSDGSAYQESGRFDYIDTQVNQGTDTVLIRAKFANPSHLLLPGQFVTVVVEQMKPVEAVTVSQTAMQRDQEGYFVLVVDRADQVQVRRVRVGDQVEDRWVIEEGLAEGERVITQGVQKVKPEMKVNPVFEGS